MRKNNEKIRLVLTVVVCVLFVAVAFYSVTGETLSEGNSVTVKEEHDETVRKPMEPTPRGPPPFWSFFNRDWNCWSKKPDMYVIPERNVGIGTTSPQTKLDISAPCVKFKGQLRITNPVEDDTGVTFYAGEEYKSVIGYQNGYCFWHSNDESDFVILGKGGNVGIDTITPDYKLDVEGYVQAYGYYTGDIIFQKNGKQLWRMFEDENGLYLESLTTGKIYRFVLQETEDTATLNQKIANLDARITELEALIK